VLALSVSINGDLGFLSSKDFFECHFKGVLNRLSFFGTLRTTLASAHAHHLSEQVVHATSSAATSFFKGFFSILIVSSALLRI
jgi:hypothetical protein